MTPKISICICVYKAEAYIEQCARSLFEQTLQEGLEFIFVDDCTPDKSFEVLEAVLEEYPCRKDQVKVIHLEQNGGVANARKTAMRAATGEYIIHCDPDDWVDKTIYEKLYSKAKDTNADMVYCDCIRYLSNGMSKKMLTKGQLNKNDIIKGMLYRNITGYLVNKFYRRALIEKIDLNLLPNTITCCEDMVLNFQLLQHCNKIVKLDEALYFYRVNPNSITSNFLKDLSLRRNIFKIQQVFDQILVESQYEEAMQSSQRFALYTAISSGVTTAREWHRLWKPAKRGMWRDKRWNIAQKIIFYAACVNFTLTSFVFKLLTGRLKDARR